jgi:hypothetical protein
VNIVVAKVAMIVCVSLFDTLGQRGPGNHHEMGGFWTTTVGGGRGYLDGGIEKLLERITIRAAGEPE